MKYNYSAVESNTLTFASIVNSIQTNNEALRGLESGLKASFTGEAADTGWHPQIDRLIAKINEYNDALGVLKSTVQQVAGEGGAMHVTDKDQGSRFLAINV